MHKHLAQLEAEFVAALSGLDARGAQLAPRTSAAKWSIQQIVEHLLLTYRSTIGVVQVRLGKGTATRANRSIAQWIGQSTLITLGHFPAGRQAPAAVCPDLSATVCSGEELTRLAQEKLRAMDEALKQAEAMFGQRRFASHLVLGPLSAAQWRKFHLVHGRHHMKQIREIRNQRQAAG